MSESKRTPLAESHIALGAKMVDFAGWYMPIQYVGLKEEHECVRTKVGLFDVSHMGEIFFRGPKALESLQWMTSNDVSKLKKNQAHYSLIPNFEGGIVDDIIVYCIEENQEYLVCVNAANIEKDYAWFVKNNKGAEIVNESADWAQIAIQGPKAIALMQKIFGSEVADVKYFHFANSRYSDQEAYLARTGYTGEDGFEVFLPKAHAAKLWAELLDQGAEFGVSAIGLGARDTLRTEMKYSLYGHEITDTTNPIEAGLSWVVKPAKGEFIGKDKIVQVKESGASRSLIGLELLDRGIARDGYKVYSAEGQEIGYVTSGTQSPSLAKSIGIAYVSKDFEKPGQELLVDIRGRQAKAVVVKTPFVNPKGE